MVSGSGGYHQSFFSWGTLAGIPLAGFPENGENAQDLLDVADKSLYQSKTDGRDRVTLASK